MSARVFLGDTLVGQLLPDPARAATSLELDRGYALHGSRPVLGRWFEDFDANVGRRFDGTPLPNFFRNLLPEGALRKVVEKRLGPTLIPEYTMLLRLGGDLPGAVRVESDELDVSPLEEDEQNARPARDPFRFALTGVQPKLSLYEVHDRLTVPVEGEKGHWIAKFGTPVFRELAQNEHVVLEWAARCGLDVPEHRLVRAEEIDRLPNEFDPAQSVLLVRRFDRAPGGARVHQEDFAQVFDVAPEDKYADRLELDGIHYGAIGNVIQRLCGLEDFLEYMKRLAFMVLSGNDDAHLKNWALLYPDSLHARIAPVYDTVATVAYGSGVPRAPAMRWVQPGAPTMDPGKPLVDVTIDDLLAAASCASGADTAIVLDVLEAFIGRARTVWSDVEGGAPPFTRDAIRAHLARATLR